MDKMHICLDLLCEYGYVDAKPLEKLMKAPIGIYNWKEKVRYVAYGMEPRNSILFQMEKQSGIQGYRSTKPKVLMTWPT